MSDDRLNEEFETERMLKVVKQLGLTQQSTGMSEIEMSEALKRLGMSHSVGEMVKALDNFDMSDTDNTKHQLITGEENDFCEFLKLMGGSDGTKKLKQHSTSDEQEIIGRLFYGMDFDNDGQIEMVDFERTAAILGESFNKKAYEQMLEVIATPMKLPDRINKQQFETFLQENKLELHQNHIQL